MTNKQIINDYQYCFLFYSKYSEKCKSLMNALKECPINFYEKTGVKIVCLDNKNIRKRVLQDKNIRLKTVPTIVMLNNGNVLKLNYFQIIKWIETVVYNEMKRNEEINQQKEMEIRAKIEEEQRHLEEIRQQNLLKEQEKQEELKKIKELEESKNNSDNQMGVRTNVRKVSKRSTSQGVEESSINNVIDDENGLDGLTDLGKIPNSNRIESKVQLKSNVKKSIMETAMEMQKARGD